MCLFCAEFGKGAMTPKEVVRALMELDPKDPHVDDVQDLLTARGAEYSKELELAFEEQLAEELRRL